MSFAPPKLGVGGRIPSHLFNCAYLLKVSVANQYNAACAGRD
jgi:hypothetical protein